MIGNAMKMKVIPCQQSLENLKLEVRNWVIKIGLAEAKELRLAKT